MNKAICSGSLVRVNDGFVKYYGTPRYGIVLRVSEHADRNDFVIVSFGRSMWTLLAHECSLIEE